MPQEEKIKLTIDAVKFIVYLISLILSVSFAYNNIDKRLALLENQMNYKVDMTILAEKLESIKEDLSRKIEQEIDKIRRIKNKGQTMNSIPIKNQQNPEDLILGGEYYISFNGRQCEKVMIVELLPESGTAVVEIIEGKRSGEPHVMFYDEIRSTKEEAKKHPTGRI